MDSLSSCTPPPLWRGCLTSGSERGAHQSHVAGSISTFHSVAYSKKVADNNEAGFGLCLLSSCRLSELLVARLPWLSSGMSFFSKCFSMCFSHSCSWQHHVVGYMAWTPRPLPRWQRLYLLRPVHHIDQGVTLTSLKGNTTNFHSHSVAKLHCGFCKGRRICGIKKASYC